MDVERRLLMLQSMVEEIYDKIIAEDEKRECPVCHTKLRLYMPVLAERGEYERSIECPVCGSYNRHRTYALFFQSRPDLFDGKIKLLQFGPEYCFYNKFKENPNIDYYPVDINRENPLIRKVVDITDIPWENHTFDFIIANHVLEHVLDDKKAMQELYRVMKVGGHGMLNVPINLKYAHSFENLEYNTPELRLKYFGQEDHVRWYGTDYPELLRSVGFHVEIIQPHLDAEESFLRKYGVYRNETIYLVEKW